MQSLIAPLELVCLSYLLTFPWTKLFEGKDLVLFSFEDFCISVWVPLLQ